MPAKKTPRGKAELTDRTPIWHYFDFAKFVSLLESKSLFFPSASNLSDPFEGALPFPNLNNRSFTTNQRDRQLIRGLTLISSWHLNFHESFAMWKLYAQANEAVAIQSTVGALKRSLSKNGRFNVLVHRVDYIDYTKDLLAIPPGAHLNRFLCKAKPFSYENEIRAVIDLYGEHVQEQKDASVALDRNKFLQSILQEGGAYVRADLRPLLKNVYVSPSGGKWFLQLVESILKRYRIRAKLHHSVLAGHPVY